MYEYANERKNVFTESGVKMLLEVREKVRVCLSTAGAFKLGKVMTSGDSWICMACVDYLVELEEICEVTRDHVWGQHRVFVAARTSDD